MPLLINKQPAPRLSAGRPNSIEATEDTLATLAKLGELNCTRAECAAWFGCTEKTFITFLQNNPDADFAFERGKGILKVSLKRMQTRMALAGNVTMLIWQGKQTLGQKDKIEHGGDATAPVRHVIEYIITDPAKGDEGPPADDGPADER